MASSGSACGGAASQRPAEPGRRRLPSAHGPRASPRPSGDDPPSTLMSEPEGRGVVRTEERGTSDKGRRRLWAPGGRAGGTVAEQAPRAVVAVVTDSTACLTPDLAARYGIRVVPLRVVAGTVAVDDGPAALSGPIEEELR